MKVVFVRHGESEANVADFINDDPKRIVNLTERGREQAVTVAETLRSMAFRIPQSATNRPDHPSKSRPGTCHRCAPERTEIRHGWPADLHI
jgi:coenzyme F420-reducing hydrogenase alpha subunit